MSKRNERIGENYIETETTINNTRESGHFN